MISEDRPLYILTSFKEYPYSDAFYEYGKWTLAADPYSKSQLEWESCGAEFRKDNVPREAAIPDTEPPYAWVKCMEPAVYYVMLDNRGLIQGTRHSFCEFHRPRITDNI